MCRECTEGEHAEHPTVPLKDVVEQHKASLQVQLDAVNKRYGDSTDYFPFYHWLAVLPWVDVLMFWCHGPLPRKQG